MTDKERIEEQEKPMRIYVDELPKSCAECIMCRSGNIKLKRNGRYVEANTCVLGLFHKYHSIDDEINTCPLKTIQSIQNAKAVEALHKVSKFAEKQINECNKLVQEETEDDYYIQAVNARQSMCFEFRREINQLIKSLQGEDNGV